MKKLLLAGLAVGALAAGAPAATAGPETHYYRGGCSFSTVNDTTPNQALGGNESWNGEINIIAESTDGGSPALHVSDNITVGCELLIDGVSQGIVFSASGSNGFAVGAKDFQFSAEADAVVSICDHVSNSGGNHVHCDDATTTPLVPQPVQDAIVLVIDALNNNVFSQIDPTLCDNILIPLKGTYGPIIIDEEGDIYLFGTTYDHLWWDCPTYETPPPAA